MEKVKKESKLKGCFKHSLIPTFLIVFCIVIAILSFIPVFSHLGEINDYKNLIQELSKSVEDKDMSQTPIDWQDNTNLQNKVNAFVECKEFEGEQRKPLFDFGGNFIYENIKRDNINVLSSKLELDKRNLGAFVNSLIGAGWIEGAFDSQSAKKFISVLDVLDLKTQEDITHISFILRIDTDFFGEEKSKETLSGVNNYLYFVYSADFSGIEVKSSTLQVNKLSDKSNKLLLQTLFNSKDDEQITNELNTIMIETLKQLQKIETEWGFSYMFVGEKLVISAE